MAYQPKLFGRISDPATETVIDGGTLSLTPGSWDLSQNSDYHPNGNTRTWQLKGTLGDIRLRAAAIAKTNDELGTLGEGSTVTLSFRRMPGYTTGKAQSGQAEIGMTWNLPIPTLPDVYPPHESTLDTVKALSIPLDYLMAENPYNEDGAALASLTKLEYYVEGDPDGRALAAAQPPYMCFYGLRPGAGLDAAFIGLARKELTDLSGVIRYVAADALNVAGCVAVYGIPCNDLEAIPTVITFQGGGYYTVGGLLTKSTSFGELFAPVMAYYPLLSDNNETWRNYPTLTGSGGVAGSITTDVPSAGYARIDYDCKFNVYTTHSKGALYSGTVTRTYYSYAPSTAKPANKKDPEKILFTEHRGTGGSGGGSSIGGIGGSGATGH